MPIVKAARARVQSLRKQDVDDEDKLEIAVLFFIISGLVLFFI